jgi:WD40 repeat protein
MLANQAAWSPIENLVAVATLELGSDSFSNNYQLRVGAMLPEGLQWRWFDSETTQNVLALKFSADGKFLAALQQDAQHRATFTVIYDVATGQRLREIESTYAVAWSSTGHQLALSGANGVYLVSEPAHHANPPTLATNLECYSLIWNPGR